MAAVALMCGLIDVGAAAQDYSIRIGDRLDVSVIEDPGLNRQVLVRPDGRISLPLAGTLVAAGRTPEALQAAIRQALARDFVSPPTVTVALAALAPETSVVDDATTATIYVVGQVGSPGRFDVPTPIDALQMLAVAGGPSPFAARQRIQIRRRSGGAEQVLLFDYDLVERGLAPGGAVALMDGDVIVVPERRLFE